MTQLGGEIAAKLEKLLDGPWLKDLGVTRPGGTSFVLVMFNPDADMPLQVAANVDDIKASMLLRMVARGLEKGLGQRREIAR